MRVEAKGLKKCKTGQKNCEITADTKSCIYCRYQKCLKIGMMPKLVQGKRKRKEDPTDTNQEEDVMIVDEYIHVGSEIKTGEQAQLRSECTGSTFRDENLLRPSVIQFHPRAQQQPQPLPVLEAPSVNIYSSSPNTMFRYESDFLCQEANLLVRRESILKNQADLIDSYVDSQCRSLKIPGDNDMKDLMEKCVIENKDLLTEDPLFKSILKLTNEKELEPSQIQEMFKDTLMCIDNYNTLISISKPNIQNEESTIIDSDTNINNESYTRRASWMSNPDMKLTMEESSYIFKLSSENGFLMKSCVPVSLLQARVGAFMGTMSMDDLLRVFGLSRKAQNFYHFRTICSMPFFDQLTNRSLKKTRFLV